MPSGRVVEDKVEDGDGLSWLEHCKASQILTLNLSSAQYFHSCSSGSRAQACMRSLFL